jgi:glycosyltransferase involved in cell wall biosynthesis
VCFLIEDFHPASTGAITQATLLGERLTRVGCAVLVLTQRADRSHAKFARIRGLEVYRLGGTFGSKRMGKYRMLLPALWALFSMRHRFAAIVVFDLKALGAPAVVAAKILGKKCFLRAESCGEIDGTLALNHFAPDSWVKVVVQSLVHARNRILFLADGLISISSAMKREFLRAGAPEALIHDIANGIDLERFSPVDLQAKFTLRRKLRLPPDQKLFLYSGRLARGKGLEMLLRVWARIHQEASNQAHLVLVGSGQQYALSCEPELRHFVSINQLNSSVSFTGGVPNVQEYLQAADFFVFPSESEGLPVSLVEAAACGLPCIATRVDGNLDVIKENVTGVLVGQKDEEDLYRAISMCLADPQRFRRLGEHGRIDVIERFDVDKIFARYLDLLGAT